MTYTPELHRFSSSASYRAREYIARASAPKSGPLWSRRQAMEGPEIGTPAPAELHRAVEHDANPALRKLQSCRNMPNPASTIWRWRARFRRMASRSAAGRTGTRRRVTDQPAKALARRAVRKSSPRTHAMDAGGEVPWCKAACHDHPRSVECSTRRCLIRTGHSLEHVDRGPVSHLTQATKYRD
jgi:hypothetical protein